MADRKRTRCVQCGCDDLHACELAGGMPCSWVLPDLCSNPACLARDSRTPVLPGIIPARFIKTVTIGTPDLTQRRPGGYEWGCQVLLFRALRWLNDHTETTRRLHYHKNTSHLVGVEGGTATVKAMHKFALDHPALKRIGPTGAMLGFSVNHAVERYCRGDKEYFRFVGRPGDIFEFDETQAFPEEQANALPR